MTKETRISEIIARALTASRWSHVMDMRNDLDGMVNRCEHWIDEEKKKVEIGAVNYDHTDDYLRALSALTKASEILKTVEHHI